MKNSEVFLKNPLSSELLNNGVSKVAEIGKDKEQLKTLRFELENFVCDGEYGRGLERILSAYLDGLGKPEQQAAWVSGFFGSGKSHLVKMLRYLWVDFAFPDGATARSIARLPRGVKDLFLELTNRSKRFGGLQASAGTLGAGNMDNVRLAFLQLIFRAVDLPENLAGARFVLWLQDRKLLDKVRAHLKSKKHDPDKEIRNFFVSTALAEALVAVDSSYGDTKNAQAAVRAQFPIGVSPTMDDTLQVIRQIFSENGELPCTLIVVDEIQQFIGDKVQRAMDVQEIAEHCCRGMDSRLLLVGTGQSALTGTASLSRLQARFTIKVPLSDTVVENVIRQTVLAKKPEKIEAIKKSIEANSGEVSRHLHNTRLATNNADEQWYAADYPLLPVRRRFWERVLRNVDASGTTAQLRTQLKITFDAARQSADKPLGDVVPADFIYDEISSDLLNTGHLQRDLHEIVTGQRDGSRSGILKSRLCALIYLIHQLPRTAGADDGVRATADALADLLVEDLKNDGTKYRQEIPKLLAELVATGKVMQVDEEFCLQTKEGANWNHDFNRRRTGILNDEQRLNSEREEILRQEVHGALRSVALQQGNSRQPRELELHISPSRPSQPNDGLAVWMRHGWAEQEKTVEANAKEAGSTNPMLFGFLPRLQHEEFKQAIASMLAAQETIEAHGVASTAEAIQAKNSIQTQLEAARLRVAECVRLILAGSKIFLGGGNEANGMELPDKVSDAAGSALLRLFPQFADADHANWPQVLNRARGGDVGAMAMIGYQGETVRHPVCKQVYDYVGGAGKKGKEVRDAFKLAPFGWPQDAIDASLVILILAGNLRCTVNGQPVTAQGLNQAQISNASFYQDVPPLTVTQRLDLKALFQKLGVTTPNGQESAAASNFLTKLIDIASCAGGDAPQPEKPDTKPIRDLQSLSGNAQLMAIHQQKDTLVSQTAAWTKIRDGIKARLPRWQRLNQLHTLADRLPENAEVAPSLAAIESSRGLLADPDPVPPLAQKLVGGLRTALNSVQAELEATHKREKSQLEATDIWKRLKDEQRTQLTEQCGLQPPSKIKVATEDDILDVLQDASISNRRTLVEAIPQRFNRALEEAAQLLEPKAVRVTLPSATIHDDKELEVWIDGVRKTVKNKLKDGPVIL